MINTGWNKGKKYRKYKRLTEEQKNEFKRKFYFYNLSLKKNANTYLHFILIYQKLINIIQMGILHMIMFMEEKPLKINKVSRL